MVDPESPLGAAVNADEPIIVDLRDATPLFCERLCETMRENRMTREEALLFLAMHTTIETEQAVA